MTSEQPPYGQSPYGQSPYGQSPYDQTYGQSPYGQSPYGQSPQGPAGYPPAAPRSQRGLAIASLVLSLLMCGLISFVMALVAFLKSDPVPGSGRRIAAVAMVMSFAMPVLLVVGVYAFGGQVQSAFEPQRDAAGEVTSSGKLDKNDLEVGDCVNDPQFAALDNGESIDTASPRVEVVPCDEPHDMEVIATFPQRVKDAPAAPATQKTCTRKALKEFKGHRKALQRLGLSVYTNQTPTGQVVCLGYVHKGGQLTAPLK